MAFVEDTKVSSAAFLLMFLRKVIDVTLAYNYPGLPHKLHTSIQPQSRDILKARGGKLVVTEEL